MTTTALSAGRLRRVTLALAMGLLLGFMMYLVSGKREESAFYRGDFPAFYAAAEIVWSGRGDRLYDLDLQREVENHHWPDFHGGFFIFPYPPFFALLLAPLATLTPVTAKALASVILLGAFTVALLLARRASPFVRQHFAFVLVYLLSFAPLLIAIVGVQNTALSLLILALVYAADQAARPWLTGFAASLLLFKPQFGVLLFLFLLARGKTAELLGWALGALTLYLLGTLVLGLAWPFTWLQAASQFGVLNFTINGHNMISLAGLAYWGGETLWGNGAAILPWAYLVAGVLLLVSAWYVRGDDRRLVVAPALVLLLSPQTLFYDLAIAVFFLLQGLRPGNRQDILILAGLWLYGFVALMLRDTLTFPLSAPLLLAVLWLHVGRTGHQNST